MTKDLTPAQWKQLREAIGEVYIDIVTGDRRYSEVPVDEILKAFADFVQHGDEHEWLGWEVVDPINHNKIWTEFVDEYLSTQNTFEDDDE